jgi:nucleosome binding factor SPN SPT16 subunit
MSADGSVIPMEVQEEKTAPASLVDSTPIAATSANSEAKSSNGGAAAATATAASSSSDGVKSEPITINSKIFWSRLHSIYESWKKGGKPWGAMPPAGAPASAPATGPAVDSIALIYGPPNEEGEEYDRALAVQMYLFGYEFPDTALAFCRDPDTLVIITSAKKCRILEQIGKDTSPLVIKLQLHISNKADKNAANIQNFVKMLKGSKNGKRCGTIPEKSEGATSGLTTGLQQALKKSGLETGIDVYNGFAAVLAIKDAMARDCISKAADYSGKILRKFLVPKIEDVIDKEEKIAQSDLADQTEDAIKDPAKIGVTTLNPADLDSCYSPIIQSGSAGEKFDLKASAQASNNPLAYDPGTTIIVQLGARYKNYWSVG